MAMNMETLEKYFSNYGEIEEALVMMDNRTNRSRGFGYVKFKESSSVDDVLAQKQHIIDLKEVDPKRCNNRRLLKIFVGGIAINHDEEVIRDFFSQFGQVTEVNLLTSPSKDRHRGFAFVGFKDEAVVKHLISLHYLIIKGKKVEIKAMEPPNPAKLGLKNNGIFGRVSMKNPICEYLDGKKNELIFKDRNGWLEWNGMFPQTSGPSEWSPSTLSFPNNPNNTLVNSTLANSSSYPNHNPINSSHSLQAMIWPNVGQNSHVDQLDHQNTVTQSQHSMFPTTTSQMVSQANFNHGLSHNGDMSNSNRNWTMNRMSNQSHNSYFMDHQANPLLHGISRPNGPGSSWPSYNFAKNNWSSNQSQNFQNRSGNGHANLIHNGNNILHSQNAANSGSSFENWSPLNNQLNNISSNSNENQYNIPGHSSSAHQQHPHQNQVNRCWSNNQNTSQFFLQKGLFPEDNVGPGILGNGSNNVQTKNSQYYQQQQQQQPQQSGTSQGILGSSSRLPNQMNSGNLRKNGMKNYQPSSSFQRSTAHDNKLLYSGGQSMNTGVVLDDVTQFSATKTMLNSSSTKIPQSSITNHDDGSIDQSNVTNTDPSIVVVGGDSGGGGGDAFIVSSSTNTAASLINNNNNRETTGSPNSTSNSSGSVKNISISSVITTLPTAATNSNIITTTTTSNSTNNNSSAIITSSSNNQIPIPSH